MPTAAFSNQVSARGFTLVELLVVVVLLSIFAAMVLPSVLGSDDEAKVAAAYKVVRNVSRQIERHRDDNGDYPGNIESTWFQGFKLPVNPLHPDHSRTIRDDIDGANPDKWHPRGKTTESFPFWYNPSNGMLRIRVPAQATTAETLALYNKANRSTVSSMTSTRR